MNKIDLLDILEKKYFPDKEKKRIRKEIGEKAFREFNSRREAAYVFVCAIMDLLE